MEHEVAARPVSEEKLKAARIDATEAARFRRRHGIDGSMRGSGRLRMQVPAAALFNAVNSEGVDVLGRDAEQYWRDMRRRHPEIAVSVEGPVQSANGMRNRFGRVSEKWFWRNGVKVTVRR